MDHPLKTKKQYKDLNKEEIRDVFYQKELKNYCFQHVMACEYIKDLPRRMAFDKALRDKAFDIGKKPTYDGYGRDLASVICKLFDKITDTHKGTGIDSDAVSRKQVIGKIFIQANFKKIQNRQSILLL